MIGKTPKVLFVVKKPPGLALEILEALRAGGWRGESSINAKDGTDSPSF